MIILSAFLKYLLLVDPHFLSSGGKLLNPFPSSHFLLIYEELHEETNTEQSYLNFGLSGFDQTQPGSAHRCSFYDCTLASI